MTGKITGPLREQSDWAQNDEHRLGFIKNRPFYDTRKTEPLTIEWDGEIGGREHITYPLNNQLLVKVSSIVLTKAELETGEVTAVNPLIGEEETIPVTSDSINESENGVIYVLDGAILSIPTEVSVEVNGTVLKCTPGLWFKRMMTEVGGVATDVYITKLSLPSVTTGELKTIDPKFLPSGGGGSKIFYGAVLLQQEEIVTLLYRRQPASLEDLTDPSLYATAKDLENVLSEGIPFCIQATIDSDILETDEDASFTFYPSVAAIINGAGMIQCGEYVFHTAEYHTA